MAFWNRRSRRYPASLTVHAGEVAAVQRFDLNNAKHVEALVKGQQEWQTAAWFYSDAVGELKDAERFVENSFRRIALTVGWLREPDEEPVPVMDARAPQDGGPDRSADDVTGDATPDPDEFVPGDAAEQAEDIVRSFAARDGGQAILMGKLGVNIFLVGEAYIINREVAARRATREEKPDEVERVLDWEVRSKDEIRRNETAGREQVMLVDTPEQREGVTLPQDAYIERIWRAHPRWKGWADSNVRAAVGTLEELDLLAKLARASIRSRLIAGVALVPDEMDFGTADQPVDGSPTSKGVTFDRDLAEAFASVISNEADANSVAPLAWRGKAEHLKEVRILEFPRRYNAEDRAQYEQALQRLARTIELPMERIVGMSDVNHWTAWQIDEETYEAYIEPLVGVVTEGLTFGLLRPMLLEDGIPEEVVSRLVVMADPSQLVRRPDRGKVATEGYNLETPTVSGEAWRRINGYGDDDAPTPEELLRRLVFAGKVEASLVTRLLVAWGMLPQEVAAQIEADRQAMQDALAGDDEEDDGAEDAGGPSGGEGGPPDRPEDPAGGGRGGPLAAVAAPTTEQMTGDMLGAADRVLMERLLVASDAAVNRALERAGARLRTQALSRPDRFGITASTAREARAEVERRLRDVPPAAVAAALGPAAVAAAQADEELWADALAELERQWEPWVSATQDFALGALRSFGLTDEQAVEVQEQMRQDREDAWAWLLAALLSQAQWVAARGAGPDAPDEGEFDPTLLIAPGTIREALARAGGSSPQAERFGGLLSGLTGEPVGGVATGDLVRRYFAAAGFPWTGYRWEYGDAALRQSPFEPHRALGGIVFTRWDDGTLANATGGWPGTTSYYPGDHRHCRCSFTPILAAG